MLAALQQKLEASSSLPTLPAVAVQVLALCQKEDFNLAEIAKALGMDPALSTKVLKLANSPMMGVRREVKTVSHALGILGINAVKTLALSFSLVTELKKKGQDRKLFWKRSLVAAIAAQELTRVQGLLHAEEAFLGGLLQDIGLLALWQVIPEQYAPLVKEADGDHERLVELERQKLGCDHAEVGAWLLQRWKLPEFLQIAARMSHTACEELRGEDATVQGIVRAVALSGWIADIWGRKNAPLATQRARERALVILGLDERRLEPVLGQVALAMAGEVSKLFDVDSGTPAEINAILEQAKETLVAMSLQASQTAEKAVKSADHLRAANRVLTEGAGRDKLTGLFNRERLEEFLAEEFHRAMRFEKQLSVLFCDLDHFKRVNDTYGHQAGDAVLRWASSALADGMRERDLVARYGGEEFLMVLPDTHAPGASVVGERVRKKIASGSCDVGLAEPIKVTVSIGVATLTHPAGYATAADLVRAADEALYAAKGSGRNRLVEAAAK
jgi:diguanylate cyclase (GGDEF)-like protein